VATFGSCIRLFNSNKTSWKDTKMDMWINVISEVCLYGLIPVFVAFFLYAIELIVKIRS